MRLTCGKAVLEAAPERGGAIRSWTIDGVAILRTTPAGEDHVRRQACYPLIPFSNRIAGHRFSFRGVSHAVPVLMDGYSIHGAAWQCAWRAEGDTMRLEYPGGDLWPFAFDALQRLDLREDGLTVTLSITNRHDGPAPAALGLHPFFARTPDMTLQFAASSVWRNGADMIPTENTPVPPEWDFSQARSPGSTATDNCFAGWQGMAEIAWPEHGLRLVMTAGAPFGHIVVYTPPQYPFVAVEPVSNMNDGINRMDQNVDHGMAVLAPGETLEGVIDMAVHPL